ncbi:PREDICTED: uncharacterized protein LOC109168443 [Ipomoea nil]|uniref:uncharacterized protein LOC109168443 n=1 Tax=Ipomoea nil TaxID=35883 RepID=UPI000900B19C|nr:PREDICTED: uncharacterized protein LOC109168443 [Ipomoea nil]
MSSGSSERTITNSTPTVPTTPNPLSAAHHFVPMKLTSRNYLFWRTQLLPFLRGQGLMGYIDGSFPCPPATVTVTSASGDSTATATTTSANPAHAAWVQQDQAILSMLISSFSDEVMHHALGRHTARDVWDSVTSALAPTTRSRCLSLLGQFQTLRQGSNSPAEYLAKAQTIVEALALAGRPLSEDEQVLWFPLRPSLQVAAGRMETQVAGRLPVVEAGRVVAEAAKGAVVHPDVKSAGRMAIRPFIVIRGMQIVQHHAAGHANVVVANEPQMHPVADAWYPDTGASSHATPDDQMLHHSEAYTGRDVLTVGNSTGLGVSRVGHAVIPSHSKRLTMSNILHVPNLTLPLLSVYRFTNENNVYFEFHKNFFLVKDCNTQTVLLKGSTSGGLYKLLVPQTHFAFLSARASSHVWHQRLGHPHHQVLQRVLKKCPVVPNKTALSKASMQVTTRQPTPTPWGSSPVLVNTQAPPPAMELPLA